MMQPIGQFLCPLLGVFVGSGIGPFAQGRLYEAFGLAVCFWGIGFGSDVFEAELFAGVFEGEGFVAGPVVGHDALDGDAEAGVPG